MSTMIEESTCDQIVDSVVNLLKQEAGKILTAHPSKRIVIYGAGARGVILHETLRMMGLDIVYFIDSNPGKHNTTLLGKPVYEPLQVMYEDFNNLLVMVAIASPREVVPTLEGLGLSLPDNIAWIFDNESLGNGIARTEGMPLIDFFLGYNRQSDLPGFKRLGNDTGKELKIVVLGGSTTDHEVMDPLEWNDPIKREQSMGSWPRFLYECLMADGINAVIYNGGMSSYISGQEMLKLIRDVLSVKPDIVISFDGINDAQSYMRYDSKFSKLHYYVRTLENCISPLLSKSGISAFGGQADAPCVQGFCHGVEADISSYEEWYANQRIMHAVCREFNIEYVCFLQPGGLYLESYSNSCNAILRTRWFLWNFFTFFPNNLQNMYFDSVDKHASSEIRLKEAFQNFLEIQFTHVEEFYAYARSKAEQSDFIIDMVDALNGYPEVFYDRVHCTMKGNRIIAERIFREFSQDGILSWARSRSEERRKSQ